MTFQHHMGMLITVSPFAVHRTVRHELLANHRKRRKRWSVKTIHEEKPGCLQMGDTLFMHPDLYEKLKQQLQ